MENFFCLLLSFFFFCNPGFSETISTKKTICLNMIVKDESPVIRRCLGSVKPLIDYWIIVDTGSKDGTQKIIQEFMKDVPGELYENPWVNFEHNRNEALQLAKGKADYVLFIDADEQLFFSDSFKLPPLEQNSYSCTLKVMNGSSHRILLINNHLDWKWKGVLHERLICSSPVTPSFLQGIVNSAEAVDGNRSQNPQKYLQDAKILEEALAKEPDNFYYIYYLAKSYEAAKEHLKALENYEKFISLRSPNLVLFPALYSIGMLSEFLNMSPEKIVNSYSQAFQNDSRRAEPLLRLSVYYFNQKQYVAAYSLAKLACSIPNPHDPIVNEDWMYEYGIVYALGNASYALQRYEEAKACYEQALTQPSLSSAAAQEIRDNLAIVTNILSKKGK